MIENLENEIWEIHPIYKNYAGSNLGRVKSLERNIIYSNGSIHPLSERIIKPRPLKTGYLQLGIHEHNKGVNVYIHRFVYECMHHCIIPKNLDINHIDENKRNNRIENLEICTRRYNINYGTRNERAAKSKINHPKLSKKVGQYDLSGNLIKVWESGSECSRNGFIKQNVTACCRNERKTHKGYLWKYIE